MNVSLRVEGRTFTTNLICLPLSGLDIILGMDWLSVNRVMLNCYDKINVFPPVLSFESIAHVSFYICSLTLNCYGMENQGYILLSTDVMEAYQELKDIPIVREYLDVFPEDILEFPLKREIEFIIELMPRIGPISIALYRILALELVELKK